MPACCVCYTTDPTYLFPTFVSAIQARRHASAAKADVAIYSFGADPAAERAFADACRAEGILFSVVQLAAIDNAPVMLARLFLTRFVTPEYTQLLYIDGDTQIAGSLDDLIDEDVPPGTFLAANDPMTFALDGDGPHSRMLARHFAEIGVSAEQAATYFNTGVLRIASDGWDKIGMDAWALFNSNEAASRFPDQDVLNIVGGPHHRPMSLAWNFPIFMLNARVAAQISPRVYHFMSNPKPWHGAFPPWNRGATLPYIDAARRYPGLAQYHSRMTIGRQARYHLQQRYKKLLETFTWGRGIKRTRILEYERRLAGAGSSVKNTVRTR